MSRFCLLLSNYSNAESNEVISNCTLELMKFLNWITNYIITIPVEALNIPLAATRYTNGMLRRKHAALIPVVWAIVKLVDEG